MSTTTTTADEAAEFRDAEGGTWRLRITFGHLDELKAVGVDLGKAVADPHELVDVMFGDPGRLVRALYVLCRPEAERRNVSPEAFAYLFDGPTIEDATTALLRAYADFSPRRQVAAAMKKRLPTVLRAMDAAIVQAVSRSKNEASNSPDTSE